ncbi:DUF192 domain-containing protein [Aestuariibius sp. 2305UL40-4]|uniref:DUF192 domain-containing protein n=1 Tax=Aestuariibius violaceus TaxID=3234132 RepID=UPI00345E93CB
MIRACLTASAVLAGSGALADCAEDLVTVAGAFGQAQFNIELADDPEERARGLMFREDLPTFDGMLFVYDAPGRVAFWMRNTLIPLDMIFVDETGRVTQIHENAVPGDVTPIPGPDDTLAVLEINGGLAGRLGIAEGAMLGHPAFNQEIAALPCG